MFWAFGKGIFQNLANFKDGGDAVYWKNDAKHWKLLKSKFGHIKHLINFFSSFLEVKKKVLNVWKWYFLAFCKLLIDEVETISWGSERNLVKRSILENSFDGTLRSKTNVLNLWKWHFFSVLDIFEWRSWNCFLGKWGKALRTILVQIWA